MTKLETLAQRCEQATGPDWELDSEIHFACGMDLRQSLIGYTASVDAALTLVPEEWFFSVSTMPGRAFAILARNKGDPCEQVFGAAPALAITAAALRAHASITPRQEG